MTEPYKLTATDADGNAKTWTRTSWGSIVGVKHSVARAADEHCEPLFTNLQLWVLGADNVWRTIDEVCQCGCQ